jgi:Mg2+ and Co2+ transporter CorA
VTVILAGIGAVAGIFGMSEAASAFQGLEGAGFYVVVMITVLASLAAVVFLRRIDWL